jgi:hypothetical protein
VSISIQLLSLQLHTMSIQTIQTKVVNVADLVFKKHRLGRANSEHHTRNLRRYQKPDAILFMWPSSLPYTSQRIISFAVNDLLPFFLQSCSFRLLNH